VLSDKSTGTPQNTFNMHVLFPPLCSRAVCYESGTRALVSIETHRTPWHCCAARRSDHSSRLHKKRKMVRRQQTPRSRKIRWNLIYISPISSFHSRLMNAHIIVMWTCVVAVNVSW